MKDMLKLLWVLETLDIVQIARHSVQALSSTRNISGTQVKGAVTQSGLHQGGDNLQRTREDFPDPG